MSDELTQKEQEEIIAIQVICRALGVFDRASIRYIIKHVLSVYRLEQRDGVIVDENETH